MNTTKILIIDDHKLFREGMKRILDFESSFEVLAEGADGSHALGLVNQYQPDIVLMDIHMPNKNGIETMKKIIQYNPFLKVIILTIHDDSLYVNEAIKAGASGYLLKEMDSSSLINAIKVIRDDGFYLHPRITNEVVKEYRELLLTRSNPKNAVLVEYRKPLHLLTRRECEVLQLLTDGKTNKGVADSLYISEKTVKNHVSNILQKMNVNDRTQAVVLAIRNGWVEM